MKPHQLLLAITSFFVTCLAHIAVAIDDPSVAPVTVARVEVARCQPAVFGQGRAWLTPPAFLQAATIFEQQENDGNRLEFEVKEGGVALVAASWNADGDNTGDWRKGRATALSLIREGWSVVAASVDTMTNNQHDPHILFRRTVNAGEFFKLHTRQKHAPLLILPAADRTAEILALPTIAEVQAGGVLLWTLPALVAKTVDPAARQFADDPKPGSLLVGLRVTTDFNSTRLGICSLQPIYENRDSRIHGPEFGQPGAIAVTLEAKPGYAVGAIIGAPAKNIAGLQLIFMRRNSDGLEINDAYASRWVGLRLSDGEVKLGGDGRAIGGLRVKMNECLKQLELLTAIP